MYGLDEHHGYFMDLSTMVTFASGRRGTVQMRLYHGVDGAGDTQSKSNQGADLTWKRALAVARELVNFRDESLYLPTSAIQLPTEGDAAAAAVGKGAFGEVFKLRHEGTDRAIKQVKIPLTLDDKPDFEEVLKVFTEAMVLVKIGGRHPGLLNINYICFDGKAEPGDIREFYLVTEFLNGGHLASLLRRKDGENGFVPLPRLPTGRLLRIWKELFSGLKYLHGRDIIHRDIKPENIMLSHDIKAMDDPMLAGETFVKVVDFGQATSVPCSASHGGTGGNLDTGNENDALAMTGAVGTALYRAPEISGYDPETDTYNNSSSMIYSKKADIYSATMVLCECWTRERPFMTGGYAALDNWEREKRSAKGERPDIPDDCPMAIAAMFSRGWCQVPSLRPSSAETMEEIVRLEQQFQRTGTVDHDASDPQSVLRAVAFSHLQFLPTRPARDELVALLRGYWSRFHDPATNGPTLQLQRGLRPVLDDLIMQRVGELVEHAPFLWAAESSALLLLDRDLSVQTVEAALVALALVGNTASNDEKLDIMFVKMEEEGKSPVTLVARLTWQLCQADPIRFAAASRFGAKFIGDMAPKAVPAKMGVAAIQEVAATFFSVLQCYLSANTAAFVDDPAESERWCETLVEWTRAMYMLVSAYGRKTDGVAAVVAMVSLDPTFSATLISAVDALVTTAAGAPSGRLVTLVYYVLLLFKYLCRHDDLAGMSLFVVHAIKWMYDENLGDCHDSFRDVAGACARDVLPFDTAANGPSGTMFGAIVTALGHCHSSHSLGRWFWKDDPKSNTAHALGSSLTPEPPAVVEDGLVDFGPIASNMIEYHHQQNDGVDMAEFELQDGAVLEASTSASASASSLDSFTRPKSPSGPGRKHEADFDSMTVRSIVTNHVRRVVRRLRTSESERELEDIRIKTMQSLGVTNKLIERLCAEKEVLAPETLNEGMRIIQRLMSPGRIIVNNCRWSDVITGAAESDDLASQPHAGMLAELAKHLFDVAGLGDRKVVPDSGSAGAGEAGEAASSAMSRALETAFAAVRTMLYWCSLGEHVQVQANLVVFFDVLCNWLMPASTTVAACVPMLKRLQDTGMHCLLALCQVPDFHKHILALKATDALVEHALRFLGLKQTTEAHYFMRMLRQLVAEDAPCARPFRQHLQQSGRFSQLLAAVHSCGCEFKTFAGFSPKDRIFQCGYWPLLLVSVDLIAADAVGMGERELCLPIVLSVIKYGLDPATAAAVDPPANSGYLPGRTQSLVDKFEVAEVATSPPGPMVDVICRAMTYVKAMALGYVAEVGLHNEGGTLDPSLRRSVIGAFTEPLAVPAQRADSFLAISLYQDATVIPTAAAQIALDTVAVLVGSEDVVLALGSHTVLHAVKAAFKVFCGQEFIARGTGAANTKSIFNVSCMMKHLVHWGQADALLDMTDPQSWLDLVAGTKTSAVSLMSKMDTFARATEYDEVVLAMMVGMLEQRSAAILHQEDAKVAEQRFAEDQHLQVVADRIFKLLKKRGRVENGTIYAARALMDQHLAAFADFCKAKRTKKAGRSSSVSFDHLGDWVGVNQFLQEEIGKDPTIRYESVSEKLQAAFDPGLLAGAQYRINAVLQSNGCFRSERSDGAVPDGIWVLKSRGKSRMMTKSHRRYLVMFGNELRYFENEGDAAQGTMKGVMILVPSTAIGHKDKSVTVTENGRTPAKLQFETREEAERWYTVLLDSKA